MSKPYLELSGVDMRFRTDKGEFEALKNINLRLKKGEFVSLIGHSGCGKSTVLNLVAGLHAGLVYNTWPDMNGGVFPEMPFYNAPWWINFFENDGLVQFDHRIGAYVVAGFAAFIYARGIKLTGYAKTSAKTVAIITVWQVFLGIATLVLQVPELLAAAHQVTAALLLSAAVWHAFELRRLS